MIQKKLIFLVLFLLPIALNGVYAQSSNCYVNVSSQTPKCVGGTITSETWDGCRNFACSNGTNSIKIKACDKPSTTPNYFEMYRTLVSGNRLGFCLNNICFSSSDFFRSQNFSGCTTTQTNGTNQNPVNATNLTSPPSKTCYNSVQNIPASCTGGTITRDDKGGCRTIVCSNGGNSLQTMACDKGSYFEIYRQTQVGNTAFNICIGNTCLGNIGYVKSGNYPICIMSNSSNTTNTTQPPSSDYDYGKDSRLWLSDTNLGGERAPWDTKSIKVLPGQSLNGTVQLYYESRWPDNVGMAFAYTPSWGDHATSYRSLTPMPSNSSGYRDINISFVAPSTPGEYDIIFAFRAEVDAGDVISGTNWAANPERWNDGNDVASWSEEQKIATRASGRTTAQILYQNGMRSREVPAMALRIIVDEQQSGNFIDIFEEYSAEHNQVFRCNLSGLTPNRYTWYVNGVLVFEKNQTEWYNASHETYANYYHSFAGNGTYSVMCVGGNGASNGTALRQVSIITRATAAEIEGTAIVVRPKITYLGNYRTKLEAEVIGATSPAAWFRAGSWTDSQNSATISMWPSQSGSFFSTEVTLPGPMNYSIGFQGATNVEYERKPWHNFGSAIYRGCYDGPRGGTPICNAATKTLYFKPPQENILTGLVVKHVSGDTFEASCHIPTFPDAYVSFNFPDGGYNWSLGNKSVQFRTTVGSGDVSCSYQNGATDNAGYSSIYFTRTINFAQLKGNTTVPPSSNAGATITIASGYPQGNNYIFNCNAYNFTPIKYDFTFGDGQSWANVTFNNTFHTYQNGTYNVTCTAKNSQVSATAKLSVTVGTLPPSQTCYNSIQNIPATCTSTITQDTKSGCRTITCGAGSNTIKIMACDKPDSGTKQYFEMYRQSSSGSPPKICLGATCIQNEGYKKSGNYPICS